MKRSTVFVIVVGILATVSAVGCGRIRRDSTSRADTPTASATTTAPSATAQQFDPARNRFVGRGRETGERVELFLDGILHGAATVGTNGIWQIDAVGPRCGSTTQSSISFTVNGWTAAYDRGTTVTGCLGNNFLTNGDPFGFWLQPELASGLKGPMLITLWYLPVHQPIELFLDGRSCDAPAVAQDFGAYVGRLINVINVSAACGPMPNASITATIDGRAANFVPALAHSWGGNASRFALLDKSTGQYELVPFDVWKQAQRP